MTQLYEQLQQNVSAWRKDGYPSDNYPAIAEILDYATLPESEIRRYLRKAQLRALETYWYLRLVEETPQIFDLYKKYYPNSLDLLKALGLDQDDIKDFVLNNGMDDLWEQIRENEDFVKKHKIESVHETLTLDYPSYILALAMGAGKTMLIGTIIASEFAMALAYHPDGEGPFLQNALVFAPGLTIFESLRELSEVEYKKILPPRLYRPFETTYKLIFTREGETDIPVIRGGFYNLIVTNTEKIRIQKRSYRHSSWTEMYAQHMLDEYKAEANLRLRAIASLPNLGLFSDEAHHTYGKEMGARLKRVRQTVDYLHEKTNLICVVNTTGTPFYERQPLRDVVIWYGLSEGIQDGILKSLEGNIYAYDFEQQHTDQFVTEVIEDFFESYGDVKLSNGSVAKLAIYFPQTKDLQEIRPIIETTLSELGYPLDIILRNTSNSTQVEIDAFNRLNMSNSPHRVILLVNKGTEGWDCPSLFACALARKLKNSKNFVLQASTRCLRQTPGNTHRARIYLSMDNRSTLDRQLRETYGETVDDLGRTDQKTQSAHLVVRKLEIPPLVIKKYIKHIVPGKTETMALIKLRKPDVDAESVLVLKIFTPQILSGDHSILQQIDEQETSHEIVGKDIYITSTELAAIYRLDVWIVYKELKRIYLVEDYVPETHIKGLAEQIENQIRNYEIKEEEIEVALALIKPEGFDREQDIDGNRIYTTEITYRKDKEHLLLDWRDMAKQNSNEFGFHYNPYNFDSNPERDFYQQVLQIVNIEPDQVEDIYFTGGLVDPNKTDFFVEYMGEDNKWHRYSPDFVIRRKDGRCFIVEIKAERDRGHPINGESGRKAMSIRKWENLNPEKLKYEMVFTDSDSIAFNRFEPVKKFIEEKVDND